MAKIILVGDNGVGKTALISRWVESTFRGGYTPTIGTVLIRREVMIRGDSKEVQIWDTSSEERYLSIAPIYSRGARAAVIVFDVSRGSSFYGIAKWVK
jgi:Ras-related protein Rab-6A